jgi:hypothetical protein
MIFNMGFDCKLEKQKIHFKIHSQAKLVSSSHENLCDIFIAFIRKF